MNMLTTRKQVEAAMPAILRKEQINIANITLTYNWKGFKRHSVVVTGASASRVVKITDADRNYVGKLRCDKLEDGKYIASVKEVRGFTKQIIMVSIEGDRSEADKIFGGKLYLVFMPNGYIQVFLGMMTSQYYNLTTKQMVDKLPYNGTVEVYQGLTFTASAKRSYQLSFTNGDPFKIMNEATEGALADMAEEYYGKTGQDVEMALQKKAGYVGNALTASTNIGNVEGYAIYPGKLVQDTAEYYLTQEYEALMDEYHTIDKADETARLEMMGKIQTFKMKAAKTLNATQDGQIYGDAKVIAKIMNKRFEEIGSDLRVTETSLEGLMLQVRPLNIKASMVIVPHISFVAMMKRIDGMNGISLNKFGNENEIAFIADKNAQKLSNKADAKATLEVLACSKESEANLSKQMTQSLLFCGQEAGRRDDVTSIIKTLMKEKINGDLGLINGKKQFVSASEIESCLESGYIADLLYKINPEMAKNDKGLLDKVIQQRVAGAVDTIDNLTCPVAGHNRRLVSCPGFLISENVKSLVGDGEVFINRKDIKRVVMFKYPKVGVKEFYAAKVIGMKEITKRLAKLVADGKITKDEQAAIAALYRTLTSSAAVLPANMIITFQCAGLDYDFDGASFLEEIKKPKNFKEELTAELVDVLFSVRSLAVRVITD